MYFVASHFSAVGISKSVNQDSVCIRQAKCNRKNYLMAVICDGMGGMEQGEVASKAGVQCFYDWFEKRLPKIIKECSLDVILNDWKRMIPRLNDTLCQYGKNNNIRLGTTLSAIFIDDDGRYVIAHVGDSRIYEIREGVRMLTQDQSLVADEARRGVISWQQAKVDERRNILLECIGISEKVNPMYATGKLLKRRSQVLLCSDGFCHEINEREISKKLGKGFRKKQDILEALKELEWTCEKRGEQDNISAILISMREG